MNPHEDDQLRELLDNAVSDVEPRPGLDAIRSRTKVRSMPARPWFLGAAAAVVATAATITAFAVAGDGPGTTDADPGFADSPSTAGSPAGPTPEGPTPTSEPSSSDATQEPSPSVTDPGDPGDPGGLTAVPVYYVGETGQGPRLYREFHSAAADKRLATALRDAVAGPAVDPDYVTPWPAGTTVSAPTDGSVDGDQVDIEVNSPAGTSLHGRPAGMSAQLAQMAVQQLVYTAQAATQTTAPVQLNLDGDRTNQLLGVPVSEPLARADSTSTLAQVWIISPDEGALVQSGFTVEGIGAFFEANAAWELRQGDKVVKSDFTMAEECCRMAPYSFTVDAPPGDYTIVVKDQDMSGGEGFLPFEDSKNITITD